jgi:hypothetical protein
VKNQQEEEGTCVDGGTILPAGGQGTRAVDGLAPSFRLPGQGKRKAVELPGKVPPVSNFVYGCHAMVPGETEVPVLGIVEARNGDPECGLVLSGREGRGARASIWL